MTPTLDSLATFPGSALAVLAALALLTGCPPDDGSGDDDGAVEYIYDEDSDPENNSPTDPEPVPDWQGSITIRGNMSDCSYDNSEDWPWTGDEDNYRVEVPEDGYLDATLTWDEDADLDLLIYFEPPSPPTISPDEIIDTPGEAGIEQYLFDDELERGDDIVLGVVCASGDEPDYELVIGWES